jgi:putative ABC transport system permease protein
MSQKIANKRTRRTGSSNPSMFLRMLWRAATLRKGRAATALLALVVGAAVATTMLNLFADVQAKLRTEFRKYGANVIVIAKDGDALPPDALARVQKSLDGHGIAAPFAYAAARSSEGQSVVVSGTDFDQVRQMNAWWSVDAWPHAANEALVGRRAARAIDPDGKPFDLSFHGRTTHVQPVGTLQTGSDEDSRIYFSLTDFENWTGVQPSTIEIAAFGTPQEVEAVMRKLADDFPQARVSAVRQITEGEANVLGKTRATVLAASVLIVVTAALCLLATLMGWVFDRRRDFAIMKALGASEGLIRAFFAAEAAALGAVGAIFGFAIGVGAAAWIGRVNFQAAVTPRLSILPVILAGSVGVALIAAVLPISLLRRIQPAMILRGE